jgi:replicative DNA helicase
METTHPTQTIEQALLGSIIHHPHSFRNLAINMRSEYFRVPLHVNIVTIFHELDLKNIPIDMLIIAQTMADADYGREAIDYLNTLPSAELTANVQDGYIEILKHHCERNYFEELGAFLSERSNDPTFPTRDLYRETDTTLKKLATLTQPKAVQSMSDVLSDYLRTVTESSDPSLPWFDPSLQKVAGTFSKGDLAVLGARPGMGKTSFMITQTLHTAFVQRKPVLYISLELSAERIVEKLFTQHTRIPLKEWKDGAELTGSRKDTFLDGVNTVQKLPIYILDDTKLSLFELRNVIRQYTATHGIELVVVDYLQLIQTGKKHSIREQEISMVSRTLKLIARELGISVMVSSQLSRASEKRGSYALPMLSDLRESGSIEQDADKVLFLYRPEYYRITEYEDGTSTREVAEIHVAKNRMGPLDFVRLRFDHATQLFEALQKDPAYYRFGDFDFPPSRDDEFPPAPF